MSSASGSRPSDLEASLRPLLCDDDDDEDDDESLEKSEPVDVEWRSVLMVRCSSERDLRRPDGEPPPVGELDDDDDERANGDEDLGDVGVDDTDDTATVPRPPM